MLVSPLNLFRSAVPWRTLARLRLAYCLVLVPITIGQLVFAHAQYRTPPETYIPIPLFRWLGIGLVPERVTLLFAVGLVGALILAAVGVRPRAMLLLALPLYLAFFGITTGWRWRDVTSSRYALEHALHPTFLLVLACAPTIGLGRLRFSPGPRLEAKGAPPLVPSWPLSAMELALGLSYMGAFYTKIADSGLAWANGYNLQTYLLERYSFLPSLHAGLWLAQHVALCRLLSIGTLLFESLFVTVVFVQRRSRARLAYAGAGLSLHLMTWWTMGISVFVLSYCAGYLTFLDALDGPVDATLAEAPPLPFSRFGAAVTGTIAAVMLGCILGRVNRWPLVDWCTYCELADWRDRVDITRCELALPGGRTVGCAALSPELARRVQLSLLPGEVPEDAVRRYLTTVPKRSPPPGSVMHLWARQYVTENGVLQPRFFPLSFVP
jgi:hypothetical protein